MPYRPQTTDTPHKQHTAGRPSTPPRRAPNDFLDYNHGPDSFRFSQRQPDGRRWSEQGDKRLLNGANS